MKIPPPQTEEAGIATLQSLIRSNCVDTAENCIKDWGWKFKIIGGKLVDMSNSTAAWLKRFITVDENMLRMKKDVEKLSPISDEVLIVGPTGTGKEIIAHALHGNREGRFIAVNCAGIVETLIESELFGHEKNAFTGAATAKEGLMKVAEKGTLFLDEIGELPMDMQAKFLRAIQEKHIRKVGGTKEEKIDCRIVCATNRNLFAMTEAGKFREDLLARISTFMVEISPLCNRQEDITAIIKDLEGGQEYLNALDANMLSVVDISTQFNVRSLQQHVRRYTILGRIF